MNMLWAVSCIQVFSLLLHLPTTSLILQIKAPVDSKNKIIKHNIKIKHKNAHNKVFGNMSWFLERDMPAEFFNCIFMVFWRPQGLPSSSILEEAAVVQESLEFISWVWSGCTHTMRGKTYLSNSGCCTLNHAWTWHAAAILVKQTGLWDYTQLQIRTAAHRVIIPVMLL